MILAYGWVWDYTFRTHGRWYPWWEDSNKKEKIKTLVRQYLREGRSMLPEPSMMKISSPSSRRNVSFILILWSKKLRHGTTKELVKNHIPSKVLN